MIAVSSSLPGMTLVMLHLEFGPRLIEFAPIVIGVSLLLSAETQVPWNFAGTVSAACVCPSRASVKAVVVNRLFFFSRHGLMHRSKQFFNHIIGTGNQRHRHIETEDLRVSSALRTDGNARSANPNRALRRQM